MKKLTFTLLCLFGAAWQMDAQITISSYSGVVAGTYDSIKIIDPPYASLADVPGTNKTWDETGLNYSTGMSFYNNMSVPAGATFPSGQWGVVGSYFISRSKGIKYDLYDIKATTSGGVVNYGEYIPRQNISVASVTFSPNDSVVFPQQSVVYSKPDTILKFPATYLTNWTSSVRFATTFYLYIAAASLHGDTAVRVTYLTEKDSVVGWGKMKVKDGNGNNSGFMNVLEVRKSYTITDSFYLNRAVASASLLIPFGLSQGMVTNAYEVSYYRAGEIFPLLRVGYNDNTYNAASNAETHTQRLQQGGLGVNAIALANGAKVYPNPVTNHAFTLELAQAAAGNWSYELINMAGQQIVAATIPTASNQASVQVALPSSLTAGIYFVRLFNNGQEAGVLPVDIAR